MTALTEACFSSSTVCQQPLFLEVLAPIFIANSRIVMAKNLSAKPPTEKSIPPTVTGKRKRAQAQTKECVVCVETKPLYRNFPAFSTCSHGPDTCSACVAKQTITLLETSRGRGWSVCRCPQCDVPIPTQELQAALPRAVGKEMKEMVDEALVSNDYSWRWCLASGCGHGSLQHGWNEIFRCRKCGYKMCFKHQVPWHKGYTCQEYETSHPSATITNTNEEMIGETSKPCPGCGIAVQKDGGCNHMSCERPTCAPPAPQFNTSRPNNLTNYRQPMWYFMGLGGCSIRCR